MLQYVCVCYIVDMCGYVVLLLCSYRNDSTCVLLCCRAYSAMVSLPRRRGLAILYGGDDRFESGVVGQIISVS